MSAKRKPRVVLTENDVQLFHWLWMLRVLTLRQLRRLGYYQPDTGRLSSMDNVRKRLKRLWDAGYFEGDRLAERKERIYVLGDRALKPLRETYGIRQWRLYQPRFETEAQILHPLLVSECAVRVVEALRRPASDLELASLQPLAVPFVHTHLVGNARKRKHVERFVSQEDLEVEGETLRIRPDLVFGLEKDGRGRLYFLEADRGTERPVDVAAKLAAYAAYLETPDPDQPDRRLWQRYGPFGDFRVLVVTTTRRRVRSLASTLRDHPGWDLVNLTTASKVRRESPLFDEIWLNRFGEERALAKS